MTMTKPNTDKQTKALELLHDGVRATLTSDTWKAALALRAKFHAYSFNNLMLIAYQRPDATRVAGFKKWKEMGRQVRKGEKGIAILAPLIAKRENDAGEIERVVYGFRTVYVFDVSQTDGAELPDTPEIDLLDGSDDRAGELLARLSAYVSARGWKLTEGALPDGARGMWSPMTSTITLAEGLPTLHAAKTLAHEVAHAHLEHDGITGDIAAKEFEAETTAFLILNAFGLDASSYSFAYLASWAGDVEAMKDLLSTGARALKAADEIVAAVSAGVDAPAAAA